MVRNGFASTWISCRGARFQTAMTLFTIVLIFGLTSAANAQIAYRVSAHDIEPIYTTSTRAISGAATTSFAANGITYSIWYQDVINANGIGFDDATDGTARRARLEEVLTYIADVMNETGALDIWVKPSELDGTGFLASAGTWFPGSDGFLGGSALWRIVNGSKQFGASTEEIFVTVDFGFSWYEGSGTNPGGLSDLLTVLLHEITQDRKSVV